MIENTQTFKFPEDRFDALKEAQRLSGLSQAEFDTLLKALAQGYDGEVGFGHLGDFSLHIRVYDLVLTVEFDLETGMIERIARFRFSLKELGLSGEEPDYDWKMAWARQ